MSVSRDVFIQYPGSLHQLVQEIAPALGFRFQLVPDAQDHEYDRYEAAEPEGRVRLFVTKAAGFDNDRELNFNDFQYFIGVGGSHEEQAREAQALFERLKAAGRYRLMLVHDMQRKLDEFSPAARPALSPIS